MSRRVQIQKQSRIFDDFFKIDEIIVAHEQYDGTMSAEQRRLVFERGDSVAVLILDLDSNTVAATEQFKVPTMMARRRDDPSTTNGWITEAMAGMIDPDETPIGAVIREAMEETGYKIRNPKLIAKFFSSPGGTSERIFLFFATVRGADRLSKGGGLDGEDVRALHIPVADLFNQLDSGLLEDPKLIIAAYWLQNYLHACRELGHLVELVPPREHIAALARSKILDHSTVRYALADRKDVTIGYKTGPIDQIHGVSIWVNSENTDMMMDRVIGQTISAKIRYLGANKDEQKTVVEDTIAEGLRNAVGLRAHVKVGTVLMTEAGMLSSSHQVRKIFHVASVEGGPGERVQAHPDRLNECVENLLIRADQENSRFWRVLFKKNDLTSILIPMLGAGDGGLAVETVAQALIPTAVNYFRSNPLSSVKEVYFLAFKSRDRDACDSVLEQLRSDGILQRLP
ncbi:MAG: NUDIX domain-containing protein [Methylovirgula sp.]